MNQMNQMNQLLKSFNFNYRFLFDKLFLYNSGLLLGRILLQGQVGKRIVAHLQRRREQSYLAFVEDKNSLKQYIKKYVLSDFIIFASMFFVAYVVGFVLYEVLKKIRRPYEVIGSLLQTQTILILFQYIFFFGVYQTVFNRMAKNNTQKVYKEDMRMIDYNYNVISSLVYIIVVAIYYNDLQDLLLKFHNIFGNQSVSHNAPQTPWQPRSTEPMNQNQSFNDNNDYYYVPDLKQGEV